MLQALELNGFKSFADRTRLEFPKGITVVVGPNGSGKSNVVDAVKWVLGAQSAKALRGKEMADVIFSGSNKRRACGAAEVSLIFDNTTGILGHDADQVQLTRRVFRSGESEYLLNGKSCRLRDLRDVLSGTGMAGGAYSIIEQGKVDALLQSSPADRRHIFEEAAGISRFKVKRQEAARRLERVQQNLLRLTDIVEELQSRLNTVRSQAGRAQQYQDVHARLRELQVTLAIADWQSGSAEIKRLSDLNQQDQQQITEIEQKLAACEQQLQEADAAADQHQAEAREQATAEANLRERIATCETSRASQLARVSEIQQETNRLACQLLKMQTRAGDSHNLFSQVQAELAAAEEQYQEMQASLIESATKLEEAQQRLAQLKGFSEENSQQQKQAERTAQQLEGRAEMLASQLETLQVQANRRNEETTQLFAKHQQFAQQLEAALLTLQESQALYAAQDTSRKQQQTQLRRDQRTLAKLQKQQGELQGQLTGARERSVVLEELERRLDGLSAGTKEVLCKSQEEPEGPYGAVRGVVADLLRVDADTANLIEIALGERANQLVIDSASQLATAFAEQSLDLPGRTVFLRLDVPLPASAVDRIDLTAELGVMGRADQFVEADADLESLVRRLLGRIWLVDTLATAWRLANGPGRGLSFVTVAGEVLGGDGVLAVGPPKQNTGLLSRRNELRALQEKIESMEAEAAMAQQRCHDLEASIAEDDQALHKIVEQCEQERTQLHAAQLAESGIRQEHDQASAQLTRLQEKQTSEIQQIEAARAELAACQEQATTLRKQQEQFAAEGEQAEQHREALEAELAKLTSETTERRVILAGSEQRRDGLLRQAKRLEQEHDQRSQDRLANEQLIEQGRQQAGQRTMSVLELSSEIAELVHRKEQLANTTQSYEQRQAALRASRQQASRAADALRQSYLQRQQRAQQLQLQLQQAEHQRTTLADRLREQHQLELALIAQQHATKQQADQQQPPTEIENRAEVEREIGQLQAQMKSTGPVNLEAVAELDSLESRYEGLAQQHDDLQTARKRLEQIVSQINVESRQLFIETIDEVRTHFQELFRNLFGGGEADIVVEHEEGADVLECGIEIVARPPGKQPRSISLLSGGERTMTCVALLLAIFKSRPSPFCVLDEVDAALDEANIDRFVEVLKEFMGSTQFIVITHSKRTMTCSDTLYGVTMQESGVSKRVSVRFEDVTEDGHIKPSALKRAA